MLEQNYINIRQDLLQKSNKKQCLFNILYFIFKAFFKLMTKNF